MGRPAPVARESGVCAVGGGRVVRGAGRRREGAGCTLPEEPSRGGRLQGGQLAEAHLLTCKGGGEVAARVGGADVGTEGGRGGRQRAM